MIKSILTLLVIFSLTTMSGSYYPSTSLNLFDAYGNFKDPGFTYQDATVLGNSLR